MAKGVTNLSMKMIDKLCDLLDKRGVSYTDSYTALNEYRVVSWRDKNYREVDAIDYFNDSEHQLKFCGYGFPEEIIDMSLGAD